MWLLLNKRGDPVRHPWLQMFKSLPWLVSHCFHQAQANFKSETFFASTLNWKGRQTRHEKHEPFKTHEWRVHVQIFHFDLPASIHPWTKFQDPPCPQWDSHETMALQTIGTQTNLKHTWHESCDMSLTNYTPQEISGSDSRWVGNGRWRSSRVRGHDALPRIFHLWQWHASTILISAHDMTNFRCPAPCLLDEKVTLTKLNRDYCQGISQTWHTQGELRHKSNGRRSQRLYDLESEAWEQPEIRHLTWATRTAGARLNHKSLDKQCHYDSVLSVSCCRSRLSKPLHMNPQLTVLKVVVVMLQPAYNPLLNPS